MATHIFCPICTWAPGPLDRWQCRPGCYSVWNTFETHACCPGCHKQWEVTACLACGVTSLHEEWYHDDAQQSENVGGAVEQHERHEVTVPA
jgi:hypothetical protein